MIKDVMLAWYGSYVPGGSGGQFGELIQSWEQLGVFSYMIPFLLIFAVVYGILNKLNLFGESTNKTINAIISLGVALMAIQFEVVPIFFSDIFPRLGIAMACVLVFIILMGLFGEKDNTTLSNTLMWSSFGVAILIVVQSTEIFREGASDILGIIPGDAIPIIALIILFALVIMSARSPKEKQTHSSFMKALGQ